MVLWMHARSQDGAPVGKHGLTQEKLEGSQQYHRLVGHRLGHSRERVAARGRRSGYAAHAVDDAPVSRKGGVAPGQVGRRPRRDLAQPRSGQRRHAQEAEDGGEGVVGRRPVVLRAEEAHALPAEGAQPLVDVEGVRALEELVGVVVDLLVVSSTSRRLTLPHPTT